MEFKTSKKCEDKSSDILACKLTWTTFYALPILRHLLSSIIMLHTITSIKDFVKTNSDVISRSVNFS